MQRFLAPALIMAAFSAMLPVTTKAKVDWTYVPTKGVMK
jgi:hypothetical protein